MADLFSSEIIQPDDAALHPPDGAVSNFDNPSTKNHIALAVIPICLVAATIAFSLRAYTRLFCAKKIGLSDVLMIVGYACYVTDIYIGYRVIICPGTFIHQWDVRMRDMPEVLLPLFISKSLYTGVLLTLKAAILLEWVRIFVPRDRRNMFCWSCYAVLGANTIFYVIMLFVRNFACVPAEKIWNPMFVGGYCGIDMNALNIASAAVNLFSDVIMAVLPQKAIWGLILSTRTKLGLSALFTIGIFCCVTAGLFLGAEVVSSKSGDILYNATPCMLWALGEMTCAFLVFGLPSVSKFGGNEKAFDMLAGLLRPFNCGLLSRTSKHDIKASWPGRRGQTRCPRVYRRINEHGIILTTIDSTKEDVPSESLERLKESVGNIESGIVRTTQFVTREEYRDFGNENFHTNMYDRQHPWAKDRY
ncbi:hypothetical protein F4779DRAFT_277749 [Xylariaceae sp. FL0662B]|nr:hypothetical protein F4779DRAFT_277749 [Xylariaceae sp. FL0662B]